MLLHLHILPIILEPAFCDSEEVWETEAFLQTRARQRAWGGGRVYPRKVSQCPAPFQLESFPQGPCLVLRRAACPEGGLLSPSAIFLRVSSAAHGQPLSSRDGRGLRLQPPMSSWTQSRNFCRVAARCAPGSWAGCAPQSVCLPAFIKELVALPPTCVGLLEAFTWVSHGPAAPHVARCIHPRPVAAAAQSGCLKGGLWRFLSPGR